MSSGAIKLNNSTEVIPIQGSTEKRHDSHKVRSRLTPTVHNPSSKSRHDRRRMPYFSDPMIVPRVKQYLEEHSRDVRIDFEAMVDSLQGTFKDYGKRKRSAFKGLVDKAYYVVLQECKGLGRDKGDGNVSTESSGEEDFDSDEMMDEDSFIENGNKANMQLMSMYANTQTRKSMQPPDLSQELINISSSEDEGDGTKMDKLDEPSATTLKVTEPTVLPQSPAAVLANFPVPNGTKHIPSLLATPIYPPRTSSGLPYSVDRLRKRKATEMSPSNKIPVIQKRKREVPSQASRITFKDFGGNAKVLEEVCKLLVHIRHPEVYRQIGVSPPRGFLLHGPPGCGKTLLAQAIAGELDIPLMKVAAPELVAGVSGQSEERIRDLFDQAVAAAPCILFLDEIDAITPNRQTAQREMERRIVAQLLTCLDDLGQKENGDQVLVIGATNRPDALDPALRRAGRFDREICLGIPNLEARIQILEVVCGKLRLAPGLNFQAIGRNTPGFVGADLMALTREAAMAAVNRVFGDLKNAEETKKKLVGAENMAAVNRVFGDLKNAEETKKKLVGAENMVNLDKVELESDEKTHSSVEKPTEAEEDKCKEDKADDKPTSDKPTNANNALNVEKPAVDKTQDVKPAHSEEKDKENRSDDAADDKPKEDVENTTNTTDDNKVVKEEKMDVCEDSMQVPVAHKTSKVVELASENSAAKKIYGPVLEELISWLHDQVPLSPSQLDALFVEEGDFKRALKCVQPSAKREGFATVPDVTWDDIGSLQDIREELKMAILAPVRHPAQCISLGLSTPTGVLLCGPPGCGKTLLAKAVANEAGVNFISVKGPELLNMYVGESERAVRQCFQRARNSAPCVIFFDELDALCPKRSESGEGASNRVVNQMLTEMDGIEGRKDVYLMAATNRPDIVDNAVLRPGRLDKILYVGLPSAKDRVDILYALTKKGTKPSLASDVCLQSLGESSQCEGYTGADLGALVREASLEALKEALINNDTSEHLIVSNKHFLRGLEKIRPSVSDKSRKHYEKLRELYTTVPPHPASTGEVKKEM